MWIWILFFLCCIIYFFYVGRNGYVLPSSLVSMFKRRESEEVGVAYDVEWEGIIFSYWIDTLNRIIKETQMKHYMFVETLPPINKAEKETLYCILNTKYTFKEPFFRTYILTDDGAYKYVDIKDKGEYLGVFLCSEDIQLNLK